MAVSVAVMFETVCCLLSAQYSRRYTAQAPKWLQYYNSVRVLPSSFPCAHMFPPFDMVCVILFPCTPIDAFRGRPASSSFSVALSVFVCTCFFLQVEQGAVLAARVLDRIDPVAGLPRGQSPPLEGNLPRLVR